MAALFTGAAAAGFGASYGAFAHSVLSAGLFFVVGTFQEQIRARELAIESGLWVVMPRLSMCFVVLCIANAGLPGTIGFYGEVFQLAAIGFFSPASLLPLFMALGLAAVRFIILPIQLFGGPLAYRRKIIYFY